MIKKTLHTIKQVNDLPGKSTNRTASCCSVATSSTAKRRFHMGDGITWGME